VAASCQGLGSGKQGLPWPPGWQWARGGGFWGATSWIAAAALAPHLRSAPRALLPPAPSLPFARANCCLGHAKKKPNSFPTFVNRRQNTSKNGAAAAVISGLLAAARLPAERPAKGDALLEKVAFACLSLVFSPKPWPSVRGSGPPSFLSVPTARWEAEEEEDGVMMLWFLPHPRSLRCWRWRVVHPARGRVRLEG